jgi:hypothetical protein
LVQASVHFPTFKKSNIEIALFGKGERGDYDI